MGRSHRFEAALRRTIAEAESSRARFGECDGVPWQCADLAGDWAFPVLDVSAEDDPIVAAPAWMRADLARRLPLSSGPLFSYALFRLVCDVLNARWGRVNGWEGAVTPWALVRRSRCCPPRPQSCARRMNPPEAGRGPVTRNTPGAAPP